MTGFIPAADDPVEISHYLWAGASGGLAFEVGANCGRSLPLMMSRFTRVVAFEPYSVACGIARQVPGADVRCMAVSDYDGHATFRLHKDQFMSAGHEAYQRPNPADRVTGWENVTVPCTTLDMIAAQEGAPDFINVDVEGHELAVLHGQRDVAQHCDVAEPFRHAPQFDARHLWLPGMASSSIMAASPSRSRSR